MQTSQATWSAARGLKGVLLSGLLGIVAPPVMLLLVRLFRWYSEDAPARDRIQDLTWLFSDQVWPPIVGCTIVCACAGWATYAPARKYRFAVTLAIVFGISLAFWVVLGFFNLDPQRGRGMDQPVVDWSELLWVLGPPVMTTVLLTLIRIRAARKSVRTPSAS